MYYKYTTEIELNVKTEIKLVQSFIKSILRKIGVDKIETADNITQFRNLYFLFSGKGRTGRDYMSIVTKGRFTVIDNDKTIIKYESYSPIWPFIVFFILFTIVSFYTEIGFFFTGCFFLGLAFLIVYLKISGGGKTLLNQVEKQIEIAKTKNEIL
jgi:hypothetical protein